MRALRSLSIAFVRSRHALSVLALSLLVFACQAPTPQQAEVERVERVVLTPIETSGPEVSIPRISAHLEELTTLAMSGIEFCDDLGPDLSAYLELIKPDFVAAAQGTPEPELVAEWYTLFDRLSVAAGRCLRDDSGRLFALQLTSLVNPLLAKAPRPDPTPEPGPTPEPAPAPDVAPSPEAAPGSGPAP
ncbi:MAG: hypothetical protein RBU37_06695 [Myxococcota bacterium]|jgi:hypothetical protein|nr:hypothetical protein [Myxococcota bacterium]